MNPTSLFPRKIHYLLFVIILLTPSCMSSNGKGGTDPGDKPGWIVIGPGGGGGVLKPTISPFDDRLVMTHCDMTAAYVSTDGGDNWKMKNLWNVPEDFEFDPADPDVIYVATRGFRHSEDRGSGLSMLYRSSDRGETWEIIYPDISKATKVDHLQNLDLLPSGIIPGAFDGTIEKVKVDPHDNNRIFLGLAPLQFYMSGGKQEDKKESAMLAFSSDHGKSWKLLAHLPGEQVKAIFPGSITGRKNKVMVFTEKACAVVDEISGAVEQAEVPVERLNVVECGGEEKEGLIYIQSRFIRSGGTPKGGMYVSRDWGKSWQQANQGIMEGALKNRVPSLRQGLAVCRTKPEIAYISVINPKEGKDGEPVDIFSILKTVNGGRSWEPVLLSSTPDGYITGNFEGSWMEKSYDPGWGERPLTLALHRGIPMYVSPAITAGDTRQPTEERPGSRSTATIFPMDHTPAAGST